MKKSNCILAFHCYIFDLVLLKFNIDSATSEPEGTSFWMLDHNVIVSIFGHHNSGISTEFIDSFHDSRDNSVAD